MPWLPLAIYDEFPYVVSCLSSSALALCLVLLVKGTRELGADDPSRRLPWPYLFYRGVRINPRLAGVDVKQWTNSRCLASKGDCYSPNAVNRD